MESTAHLSVAIVDDDESLCRSLGRLLRAVGMKTTAFASAESFLEFTQDECFDCLILDVQLGGMSGIELQRKLIAEGRTTPIIFITAHDDREAREQALAAGCASYFQKTHAGTEVIAAIRRAAA